MGEAPKSFDALALRRSLSIVFLVVVIVSAASAGIASIASISEIFGKELPLADEYPAVWGCLLALGPPITPPSPGASAPIGFVVWMICRFFWIGGLGWLSSKAFASSRKLRERADSDENTLQFHAPTWRQLELLAQRQSSIGNVSGNVDTINVMNQINNMLQRRDEEGWWTKPIGLVVIGVVINLISRAFGVL
jgi:hypothetical protein